MIKLPAKINIGKLFVQLGILMIMALMITYMNNAVSIEQHSTRIIQIGIAATLAILIVIIAQNDLIHISSFVLISGMLCGVMLVVTYVCNGLTLLTVFPYMLKFYLWLMVYIIGYIAVKKFDCEKFIISVVCLTFIVLTGIFLFSLRTDFSVKNRNYVITAVYYMLCCLPFLLELKNNKWRNTLLAITGICVCLSFKRSALLVLAFVVLILVINNLKKIKRKSMAYGIIIACIVFIGMVIYATFLIEENATLRNILGIWTGRFGEANPRESIQQDVIRRFFDSNIVNMIFGHGYDAALRESTFGLSAHNDYLEMLYDYGIVGFALYAAVIVKLLRKIKSTGTENSPRRNGYIASLTIFLVASIPSHMLTYSTYFLLISLYWGYAHGLAMKDQCYIKEATRT